MCFCSYLDNIETTGSKHQKIKVKILITRYRKWLTKVVKCGTLKVHRKVSALVVFFKIKMPLRYARENIQRKDNFLLCNLIITRATIKVK